MNNKQYVYAGFWIRVCAAIIDAILISVVFYIAATIFISDGRALLAFGTNDFDLLFFIVEFVIPCIVTVFFWCQFQGTPGKMLLNLAVVDAKTGKNLSVLQAIGRWVGYIPSYLILCLGVIWVAIDEKKQGWHDKLAGTIVIVKR